MSSPATTKTHFAGLPGIIPGFDTTGRALTAALYFAPILDGEQA